MQTRFVVGLMTLMLTLTSLGAAGGCLCLDDCCGLEVSAVTELECGSCCSDVPAHPDTAQFTQQCSDCTGSTLAEALPTAPVPGNHRAAHTSPHFSEGILIPRPEYMGATRCYGSRQPIPPSIQVGGPLVLRL
jgi:hypothetical protein